MPTLAQLLQPEPMKRGALFLIGGLLAIVLAGGGVWFYNNFSLVSESVNTGFKGEARFNSLLAAERFLASEKHPAHSMVSLVGLPPVGGTLVIPGQRFEVGPELAGKLLAWVRAGGHLVVTAEEASSDPGENSHDWLLRSVGVSQSVVAGDETGPPIPVDMDIPEADDFIQVTFPSRIVLQHKGIEPSHSMRGAYGAHVLQYTLGQGELTVLSDARFMTNASIGCFDNAAFLWHLTRNQRQGPVWLVYGGDMPPLWKWLGQHAWMVMVSAAVLFAAWVALHRRRYGPLLTPLPLARRRLLDHIEASGRFLWRNGQQAALLAGARDALRRTLVHRHPVLVGLNQVSLSSHLADLSGLPADSIERALFTLYPGNEYEFTEAINTLETIRKTL